MMDISKNYLNASFFAFIAFASIVVLDPVNQILISMSLTGKWPIKLILFMSLAFAIIFFLFSQRNQTIDINKFSSFSTLISYFLILYFFNVYLVISLSPVYEYKGINSYEYFMAYYQRHIVYFVIGLSLLDIVKFKNLIITFNILFLLVVFFNSNFTNFSVLFYITNQQIWGDNLLIVSALANTLFKNRGSQIIHFLVCSLALFLLNSRVSLFLFFLYFGLFQLFYVFKNTSISTIIAYFSAFFVFVVALINVDYSQIGFLNEFQRYTFFLIGVEDTSVIKRNELFSEGFRDIVNNPWSGRYAGHLYQEGRNEFGGYLHNIFSHWRQFGLLSFLSIIIPIAVTISLMIKNFLKQSITLHGIISLSFVLILSCILFRSYVSSSLFLALGVSIAIGYKSGWKN